MGVKLTQIKNVDCVTDKYAEENIWAWTRVKEDGKMHNIELCNFHSSLKKGGIVECVEVWEVNTPFQSERLKSWDHLEGVGVRRVWLRQGRVVGSYA
jgi:hypothetical protein